MAKDELDFFKSFCETEDAMGIQNASEIEAASDVISTGSPGLDDIIGCGGLPAGRLIQFYGPSGSGKTLLAMIAILEAQKKNPEAKQLFIDAEGTFSPQWAEELGLDTSRITIFGGPVASNGRNLFEMLLGVPKKDLKGHPAGKSKAGFLDKVKDKELNYNLIILDSLGVIIPPGEDVAEVGKINIALLSRFLTTELKKVSVEAQRANIPIIFINHVRDNMDQFSMKKYNFIGGNQLKHSLSVNILFEPINRKDAQIVDHKDNKIGHSIRATVEKTKFGPWPRKAEFKVNFDIGVVDKETEILALATEYGVVERPNNVMYVYGETKWKGNDTCTKAIAETPGLAEEILTKVFAARKARVESKKKVKINE